MVAGGVERRIDPSRSLKIHLAAALLAAGMVVGVGGIVKIIDVDSELKAEAASNIGSSLKDVSHAHAVMGGVANSINSILNSTTGSDRLGGIRNIVGSPGVVQAEVLLSRFETQRIADLNRKEQSPYLYPYGVITLGMLSMVLGGWEGIRGRGRLMTI